MEQTAPAPSVTFETSPDQYKHWRLTVDGNLATLTMDVREDAGREGSEVSSNAAVYFSNGLKGRAEEDKFDDDHILAGNMHVLDLMDNSGLIIREEVPMRNALNEVLRDWYVDDCQAGIDRWNKRVLEAHGLLKRITLPSRRFNCKVGVYADKHFDPFGNHLGTEDWERRKYEWLPSPDDKRYLHSIQATPVYQPGQFADYIAPPQRGINRQPIDFEYVRTAQ